MATGWHPDEDDRLRDLYRARTSLTAIARELGRSQDAVAARRAALGLPPRRSVRPWSALEDEMLRQATTEVGLPATVLARRLRRPLEQVRVRRRRLGLGRPGARRYTAAEDSVLRSEWPAGAGVDALARRLAIVRDGYASGLSCNEVAGALAPRTPTAVAARARRLGLATYGRRWTAEDDVRLRRILALRSVDHAARLLGRTPEGVRRRARKLGLTAPRQAAAARAGTRWTEDEDELLRLHAAVNPAVLATLLGRSDHAVVSKLRRLGLRTGRWRSPHHPSTSNGGLTPGERALVERELRDRGGRAMLSLEGRLRRPLGDTVIKLIRRAQTGTVRLD